MNVSSRVVFLAICIIALSAPAWAVKGGLNLTARGLAAVPRDGHKVFLTWRCLIQDDGLDSTYDVERSAQRERGFARIARTQQTTTFLDAPGEGTWFYRVKPTTGRLRDRYSRVVRVTTSPKRRDWVELLKVPRNTDYQRRTFADTDGDGAMEFPTYTPINGSPDNTTFKIQVYEFNDSAKPKWSFDTGLKPVKVDRSIQRVQDFAIRCSCFDVDGDFKAEIFGMAKVAGRYKLVVIKDMGDRGEIVASCDIPFKLPLKDNVGRLLFGGANLGGPNYSIIVRMGDWIVPGHDMHVWAFDVDGGSLKQRWHLSTGQPGYTGLTAGAHCMAILDLDSDGLDEIVNGGTVINHNGTIKWSARPHFPPMSHHDGMYIDDIHPGRPGLEVLLFTESEMGVRGRGDYALFEAATGEMIWRRDAPKGHLQSGSAGDYSGSTGLDVIGTSGGHNPNGWWSAHFDGTVRKYTLSQMPAGGDPLTSIDWDGARGRNFHVANGGFVYGRGGKVLFSHGHMSFERGATSGNQPFWQAFDLVGDYREEILVKMDDGTIRAYLNTKTPPFKRRAKYQIHNYLMTQSVAGSHRHYKTCAGEPDVKPYVSAGRDDATKSLTYDLKGTAIDDGKPRGQWTVNWSKVSGPGSVTFTHTSSAQTRVSFDKKGAYVLKLIASDAHTTVSDEVSLTVDP